MVLLQMRLKVQKLPLWGWEAGKRSAESLREADGRSLRKMFDIE